MKSEELFKELQFLMSKPALLEAVEAVANYSGTLTTTAAEIIRQAVMRVGSADTFKQQGQPFVFAAKFYGHTIKEILSDYDWRFARKQVALPNGTVPISGFNWKYPLPADLIRVVRLENIDSSENFGTWEILGSDIHTDFPNVGQMGVSTPLSLDYISSAAIDTTYPAIFIELVVARLAYKLAMALGAGDQAMAAMKEMETLVARPALQREIISLADASTSNTIVNRSQICKQAIMRLGSIDTLKGQPMVFANSFYDHTLEELLADAPWAFAKKQVTLIAGTAPTQGYTKKYTLPTDVIQVLRVNNIDTTENFGQWEIMGGFLHTDIGAPIIIDYTAHITDVAEFPAPFIEALIARIASKIALPLTGSGDLVAAMTTVAMETMQRPSVKILIEKSAKPRLTTSANSVSEICRQAILRVGSADVFKPYGEPMSIATSLFDQTRNELLADFDWQFARSQDTLAYDLTNPKFGYAKRYALPPTALKVLRVNGVDEDENFGQWEVVSGFIHHGTPTNFTPTIQLEYTAIVSDATKFPPVFTNMLTVTLAMKLSQLMESQPTAAPRQ